MKRSDVLGILLALGATTFAAADNVVSIDTSAAVTSDDDITQFLAVVADVRAKNDPVETDSHADDAPLPASGLATPHAAERLRKHLGLGFAEGLSDDASGQYNSHCGANGHSGSYIDGSGIRDCGDPSPSE